MKARLILAVCLATVCAACSTPTGDDERRLTRFLPPMPDMPSMPAMPSMSISDVHIPGTNRKAPQPDPSLEPVIYWRVLEDDILVVHANTHGCTARGDFQLDVEQYHEDIYTVRLVRTGEDQCREDIPWGMQLGFGFEEMGVPVGGQIVLLNPLDERAWDWSEAPRQQMASR